MIANVNNPPYVTLSVISGNTILVPYRLVELEEKPNLWFQTEWPLANLPFGKSLEDRDL